METPEDANQVDGQVEELKDKVEDIDLNVYAEGEDDEVYESDIRVISALEEFGSMPDFTNAIQSIMAEHAHKFSSNQEEQNIEGYSIFKNYVKTVEELLKDFLEAQNITESELYEGGNRISQYDTDALSGVDYLVATSEYTEFGDMMVEYKNADNWAIEQQDDDFLSSILTMKMEPPKKRESE